MTTQQVKEAVEVLMTLKKSDYTDIPKIGASLDTAISVLQSHLSASKELGEEKADTNALGRHCQEYVCNDWNEGFNSALSHARLVVAKLKAEIAELRKALYEMIEWHPKITQRIGAEGSEARYIQAHQEDAIKFATALLANKENK